MKFKNSSVYDMSNVRWYGVPHSWTWVCRRPHPKLSNSRWISFKFNHCSFCLLSLSYCTEKAPCLNSFSNCSAVNVPSIRSQFWLKTEYALGAPGCLGLVPVFTHTKQIRLKMKNTAPNPPLMNHAHSINHRTSFTTKYRYGCCTCCRAVNRNGRLCCMYSDTCDTSSWSRDRQFERDEMTWLRVVDVFSFSYIIICKHKQLYIMHQQSRTTPSAILSLAFCLSICLWVTCCIMLTSYQLSPSTRNQWWIITG